MFIEGIKNSITKTASIGDVDGKIKGKLAKTMVKRITIERSELIGSVVITGDRLKVWIRRRKVEIETIKSREWIIIKKGIKGKFEESKIT